MVSPARGDYRRCQAEIPPIDLFKFAEPVLNSDIYDQWFNPNAQGNPGGITADGPGWDGLPTSAAIILPANSVLMFARDGGDF
jgi:hypothetical protein